MLSLWHSLTPWLVREHRIPHWIVFFSLLLSRLCHLQYALKMGKSQGLKSVLLEAGGRMEILFPLPSYWPGYLDASVDYFWLPLFF